jgi:hypothetical protein
MNQLSIKIVMAMLQALLIETLQIIISMVATTLKRQLGFRNLDNILQEGNQNMSVTMQTGFTSGNINAVSQQGNNNNSSVTQSN